MIQSKHTTNSTVTKLDNKSLEDIRVCSSCERYKMRMVNVYDKQGKQLRLEIRCDWCDSVEVVIHI